MIGGWKILLAAGVPDGAIRARPVRLPAPAELRAALDEIGHEIQPFMREPLLAWLRAFAHGWPTRFASMLGPAGATISAALLGGPIDANRYLKLRRIAAENLSAVL